VTVNDRDSLASSKVINDLDKLQSIDIPIAEVC